MAQSLPLASIRHHQSRVAEAAKVIENTQRDLNIGFVNELSKIFNAMGVDTYDVLKASLVQNGILMPLNRVLLVVIVSGLIPIISPAKH